MAVSSLCLHLAVSDWSESFSTALITLEPESQPLGFVCVKVLQFSVVVLRKESASLARVRAPRAQLVRFVGILAAEPLSQRQPFLVRAGPGIDLLLSE